MTVKMTMIFFDYFLQLGASENLQEHSRCGWNDAVGEAQPHSPVDGHQMSNVYEKESREIFDFY